MACPFVRRNESIPRQNSVIDNHSPWVLEEDIIEVPDDALTLKNLNAAIQLLTSPNNEDIHEAVKSLIKKYSDKWPGILNLQVEPDTLSIYPNYDYLADIQDSLLSMDECSASEILIILGEELVATSCTKIIERAFLCLGSNLQEFLGSLDGVYDVLKLQEEDLTDTTGFVCAGEGELIFTSERPVIAWLLLGSLKALTKLLYEIEVEILMEPVEGDVKTYRFLFNVSDEDEEHQKEEEIETQSTIARSISTVASDLKLNSLTFCKAFPWHFIMNEKLELLQLGNCFSRLFKSSVNVNCPLATTYFRFKRPKGLSLKFREIARRTNTPFLISLRAPPGRPDFFARGLEIKGQMVFCPESNTLFFFGSPFLSSLDKLTENGLFISDIPLHDATREVILVGEQARAQDGLRRRMDKLKSSIEEGNDAVTKERKKNVSLLHLIFPAEIAKSLWTGAKVEAKTYPSISILFSDIVGFTSICATATPFMVISMLESLYKDFDEFCGIFDVYKVETIGDAYCVASGLANKSAYDAHKVSWMALRMIEVCSKHNTHDGQHIKMRIGLHTGTVLAGVVGQKMPRYCLFGHNVTIANKFESSSAASKINVSPTTRNWLIKHPGFDFELKSRDVSCLPKEFTNRGSEETCYFLEGYKHPGFNPDAPLKEHIENAMLQINKTLN